MTILFLRGGGFCFENVSLLALFRVFNGHRMERERPVIHTRFFRGPKGGSDSSDVTVRLTVNWGTRVPRGEVTLFSIPDRLVI